MKTTLIPIHPVELNGHEIDLYLAIEEEAVQSLVFPIEQLNRVLLASGNATPEVLDAVRRYVRLEVRTLETVDGTIDVVNAEEAAPLRPCSADCSRCGCSPTGSSSSFTAPSTRHAHMSSNPRGCPRLPALPGPVTAQRKSRKAEAGRGHPGSPFIR